MAEIILSVVTETVLAKAISLASKEISRAWGVDKDLQTLAGKIEMIEALLSDAGNKEPDSRAVQLWLRNLQAVAIDASNLLDSISYEALSKTIEKGKRLMKVRNYLSSSNPVLFRFHVAFKIKNINLTLDDVYKESVALGILAINNTRTSSDIRTQVTHPFLDDLDIVGRSDDLVKIVLELTSSTEVCVLPVIGIVGMAGKGKTALAQLIYKNEKVISCFEKRIWVCVSEHFKVENILNEMLQSLTGRNFMLTNMEAMVKKLKDELSGKCFLLVLDDVWNEDPALWECMKECLGGIGGSEGSKIIVTTRSEKVISAVQGQSYHLGLLSKEDSWTLFEKKVFAFGGAPKTSTLVDIGCRIVERCGGIPLAIKTIGGLMYSMKNESEWSEVERSKIWSSMDALGRVLLAIKLSYDHLPLSMKKCFAICSIYGKDSVLKKEELVQLWMAQGLLNPPRGSHWDMESIGNNYFDTLLQRSLLHDAKFNDYGRIVSCKMHDLVHDFALQVSKSYCLNLENGLMNNDMIKATHLYISSSGREMVKLPKGLKKLQTLFVKDGVFDCIQLTDCKYLNVLVVADWGVNDLPTSIGKLKRLRYLDIVGTNIVRLPNEITKLYHLQNLRANNLSELPKDLGNLKNLRHIYMSKGSCLLSEIRKLTSLRTLPCIKLNQDERCKMEYLGDFNNLAGEVKIVGLENVPNQEEAMKAKLYEKESIDLLELHWQNCNASEECKNENVLEGLKPPSTLKVLRILGFAGQKLPSWMVSETQPLHNLVKIQFENFQNCKQIPPLGHLPYLKFLEIRRLRSLKRIGSEFFGCKFLENATRSQSAVANSSIVAFPSLTHLQFHDMPEWKHWSDPGLHQSPFTSFELFPNLEELTIFNCPKLICIPDLLSKLSSLRRLCIFGFHCDLVSIPDIGGLRSLQDLNIGSCQNLSALPGGLEECTSLQMLSLFIKVEFWVNSIRFLTNLRELSLKFTSKNDTIECFPWPGSNISCRIEDNGTHRQHYPHFGALEFLVLNANSAVKSLPEEIQYLTALKALHLKNFYDLEALPEWLGNIHSLRRLKIWNSSKLAYLPSAEAMQRLTNLEIIHCPILTLRCKEGGPERHKIAHIPHVYLDVDGRRKK